MYLLYMTWHLEINIVTSKVIRYILFYRCFWMNTVTFEELLNKVTSFIIKWDTHLRKSIPPVERLSLTLRHLVTDKYFLNLFYELIYISWAHI